MSTLADFFAILFEPTESTCFAKYKEGISVFPVSNYSSASSWANFFTINALHATRDLAANEPHHNENVPRRANGNCISFRSFLVELDKTTIEEQAEFIASIGLPWSTCTFSGNKSLHYIVTLETPLTSKAEYDRLVKRLYKAIGEHAIDTATKNVSRLSRFPGAINPKTHDEQTLREVRTRIPNQELLNWIESKIGPEPGLAQTPKRRSLKRLSNNYKPKRMPRVAQEFLNGIYSEWTPALFSTSCALSRAKFDIEDTKRFITAIAPEGYLDAHDIEQIKNAYAVAERDELNKQNLQQSS